MQVITGVQDFAHLVVGNIAPHHNKFQNETGTAIHNYSSELIILQVLNYLLLLEYMYNHVQYIHEYIHTCTKI